MTSRTIPKQLTHCRLNYAQNCDLSSLLSLVFIHTIDTKKQAHKRKCTPGEEYRNNNMVIDGLQ